jgi:hypothetical protein
MKYFLPFLFVLFTVQGCNSQPGTNKKDSAAATTGSTAAAPVKITDNTPAFNKPDSLLNDYSLFMAGMKTANKNSIPARIGQNNFYKKYAASMDSNFLKIERSRLSKMRDWAKTELKGELANPTTLFYPFSGPDILHALQFYPNATHYVMIAMEKPGHIPDFKKMDSAQAAYYLNSVHESLQDIFEKSYFITRKMILDLQKEKVNGVAPLICLFLERTGHSVVGFEKKHLNDDGTIVALAADSLPNHVNDFIEIYFHTNGSDTLRKITYFRANLGDGDFSGLPSLKRNTALQNYLNSLPEFYTYTKSASYLMNYATFSAIRDICLKKSKSVLQDDTGIGFKYFDKNTWKLKLYGKYVTPVRDFKGVYDTGLADAYKRDSASVKPLNFSLGYHWGKMADQNLMKAEKK